MSEFEKRDYSFIKNNEAGEKIAHILFPKVEEGVFEVKSTFVDESLRGQGTADKLMREVVNLAKEENAKIIPTCSYAQKWFEKHPEENSLIAGRNKL